MTIKATRPGPLAPEQKPDNYLIPSIHARNLGTNAVVRGVEASRDAVGADDYANMLSRAKDSY